MVDQLAVDVQHQIGHRSIGKGSVAPIRTLWGARSRLGPVTWDDAAERAAGMMVSYVHPPALSDLRSGVRLAGPLRSFVGVEGHRAARVAARGRGAAPYPAQAAVGLVVVSVSSSVMGGGG
ncbi:hypothetical protein FMEAI12_1710013 [Parafrankia sp. Ea1.12]|nr:hypothetical protein FMEAI12_1710013 [Parafrankia sp. Ea1.12]